jgi:hypothetical protein
VANPSRPIGHPGVGRPQGTFGVFELLLITMLFLNMVCLTVAACTSLIYTNHGIGITDNGCIFTCMFSKHDGEGKL